MLSTEQNITLDGLKVNISMSQQQNNASIYNMGFSLKFILQMYHIKNIQFYVAKRLT